MGFGFEIIFIAEPFYAPFLNSRLLACFPGLADAQDMIETVKPHRVSKIEIPPELQSSTSQGSQGKSIRDPVEMTSAL